MAETIKLYSLPIKADGKGKGEIMSSRSWTVTGYGISEETLNVEVGKKVEFLKKFLPQKYEDLQKSIKPKHKELTHDEVEELYLEWIDNYEDAYGNMGFAPLFAEAINNHENDFNVNYYSGEYDNENAIIHDDCQPWHLSEREKNMNPEDVDKIFAFYLSEIGVKDFVCERKSIEFYG